MNYDTFGLVLGFVLLLAGFVEIRRRSEYVQLYWQNGVIGLALATILVHVAIWYLSSSFWGQWSQQRGFAAFQILFGVGIYFIVGEITKRWKYLWPYGTLLMILAGVGMGITAWHAYQQNHVAEEVMSLRTSRKTGPLEKEVTSYWKENLSNEDATVMIRIARRVSGFQQYDPTNHKEVYHNPSNHNLVGVMGIDQDKWAERSAELGPLFDIYNTKGNLKFALWLQQQQGFKPWASTVGISEETPIEKVWTHKDSPKTIPVPLTIIGRPGEVKEITVPPNGEWIRLVGSPKGTPPRLIIVRTKDGYTFQDGPGANASAPVVSPWVDLTSKDDKPVVFQVTFR